MKIKYHEQYALSVLTALCCRFVLAASSNNNLSLFKKASLHELSLNMLFSFLQEKKRSSHSFVKMLQRLHKGSAMT